MKDSPYLESLVGMNLGVLLGKPSDRLCTIDLDNDSDVEPFLDANPRLRDTTRTKRVRGCNSWVRIVGDYPPNTVLKVDGKILGEWRADGNQTIIYGQAIDKKRAKQSQLNTAS